jgi:tetratricopeptide (TPR) repeat protein
MSTGVPLGTVAVRRQLFAAQVLQLAAFSLDFARRHQGDARALDRQRDNLLQTMVACGQYAGDWMTASCIALLLHDYMSKQGRWQSWVAYLEKISVALDLAPVPVSPPSPSPDCTSSREEERGTGVRGEVLRCLGNAYCGGSQWDAAIHAHRQALRSFQRANDDSGAAHVLIDLGRAHWFRGEWDEAMRCYRSAASLARRLPDHDELLERLWNVRGLVHWRKGEWRQAKDCFRQSLRLCLDMGDSARGQARVSSHLALVHTDLGDWDDAERCYQRALALSEQVGDVTGLAYTLNDLSDLRCRQGRWEEAHRCLERAHVLWQQSEDPAGLADYHEHLGRLYANQGESGQARQCLEQALTLWQQLENPQKCLDIVTDLAMLDARDGAFAAMRERMSRAWLLARQLGRRDAMVVLYRLEATAHRAAGRCWLARWAWLRALAVALPAWRNDRMAGVIRSLLADGG